MNFLNLEDSEAKVDMRGEVGLLTRNVVIRGDLTQGTAAADGWSLSIHLLLSTILLCNSNSTFIIFLIIIGEVISCPWVR